MMAAAEMGPRPMAASLRFNRGGGVSFRAWPKRSRPRQLSLYPNSPLSLIMPITACAPHEYKYCYFSIHTST